MRLITKDLHRAFPELDRFDDERCHRFIASARGGKWATLGRLAANITLSFLVFVLIAALGIVLMWLSGASADTSPRGREWVFQLGLLFLCLAAAAAGVTSLILRDQLLRRRVARFIHARGKCPQCRYNLLGVRVPESLRINCPECGLELEVDEALTELADPLGTSAPGGSALRAESAPPQRADSEQDPSPSPILAPPKPRERRLARTNELDRWPRWFTPKRRKRTLQTLIAALILAVTIPAAWWGWNWYALNAQAKRAAAQRIGLVGIDKISESLNPPKDGTADAWDHFERVRLIFAQAEQDVGPDIAREFDPSIAPVNQTANDAASTTTTMIGNRYYPEYSHIFAPRPAPTDPIDIDLDAEKTKEEAMNKEYARRTLTRTRALGIDTHLDAMIAARRAVVAMPPYVPGTASNPMFPHLSEARATVQALMAQMTIDRESGNLKGYTRSLRASLAITRMTERCPLLVHHLVAVSCEALIFNTLRTHLETGLDAPWLDAIDEALRALPTGTTPWDIVMDAEREYVRDNTRWVFTDLSQGLVTIISSFGINVASTSRLGTLEENMTAIDRFFDAMKALPRSTDREQREYEIQLPGLRILDALLGPYLRAFSHAETAQTLRGGTALMVAIERHRAKHTSPPESLNQLVPEFLTAIPTDPLAPDGLFRYRPAAPSPGSPIRTDYILYSVGTDGTDDAGTRRPGPGPQYLSPGSRPGADYIFHAPPNTTSRDTDSPSTPESTQPEESHPQ